MKAMTIHRPNFRSDSVPFMSFLHTSDDSIRLGSAMSAGSTDDESVVDVLADGKFCVNRVDPMIDVGRRENRQ